MPLPQQPHAPDRKPLTVTPMVLAEDSTKSTGATGGSIASAPSADGESETGEGGSEPSATAPAASDLRSLLPKGAESSDSSKTGSLII